MKALVVYESMFGNTEQVARAIADGLGKHLETDLLAVGDAPTEFTDPPALIVVGGPTHAFSMTRPGTREDAVRQGAAHTTGGEGIREWLGQLHAGHHAERVATFDTKVEKVRRLPGSAAKGAAKVVRKLGYPAAAKSESFYVVDTDGPLVDGELERARAWGESLGHAAGRSPA